jgi:ABC-2 type transport system ATP-binding protein
VTDDHCAGGAPALEVVDLTKAYGSRCALAGVGFVVWPGEVVGLLGPNGAGKTTTLSILSGVLVPDAGRVAIGGRSVRDDTAIRRRLGLVPQALGLYPTLTPSQNVNHFARMQGLSRAAAAAATRWALNAVGLADRAHDQTQCLSAGMQRRLNLACGIACRPDVLLLDEPTVGVDVESRERILRLVRQLGDAGTAIVYSTHYMEEAERACDRVLLIDRGALLADGTVEELMARAAIRPHMVLVCREPLPPATYADILGVREIAVGEAGQVTLEVETLAQAGVVLERLRVSGITVLDATLRRPNLADAFLTITGHSLRDGVPA